MAARLLLLPSALPGHLLFNGMQQSGATTAFKGNKVCPRALAFSAG